MTTESTLVKFRIHDSYPVMTKDVIKLAEKKYQTILQPYVYEDGLYIAPFFVWEGLYKNDFPYNVTGCYPL